MPEAFTDGQGRRVVIRHKGPAGKGIPTGGTTGQIFAKASNTDFDGEWVNPPNGTGAAVGPASSVNNRIAVFDGTTGKLLKDGGKTIAQLATAAALADKVDKVSGRGLSQENFTTTEKTLLGRGWNAAGFRGVFANIGEVNAFTFNPVPAAGDYCRIEAAAADPLNVIWDAENSTWFVQEFEIPAVDGEAVATALFKTDEVWDKETCRIFTETEKNQIASFQSVLETTGLAGTAARAYGGVNYFSLTGTALTITGTSDGLTNTTKVAVTTALASAFSNFDNGGADNGRLRYTGTAGATFNIVISLGFGGATAADFVLGLAKNGVVIAEARQLTALNTSNDIENTTFSAVVTLLNNEYLELFVGRTSGSGDPTIHSFSITAVKIP